MTNHIKKWVQIRHEAISKDRIIEHIARVIGERPSRLEPVDGGLVHIVYRAIVRGETVFLKFASEGRGTLAEYRALGLVEAHGLRAPRVIHHGVLPGDNTTSCLMLTSLAGASATHLAPAQRNHGYVEVGRYIRSLHQIPAKRWGRFCAPAQSIASSWQQYVVNRIRSETVELKRRRGVAAEVMPVIEDRIDGLIADQMLDVCSPRLLHADLQDDHIFVGEDGCAGLLDFHKVTGGDPVFDLVAFRYFQGNAALEHLLEGYTAEMDSAEEHSLRTRLGRLAHLYHAMLSITRLAWSELSGGTVDMTEIEEGLNL